MVAKTAKPRDMLFLSHANPEDNECTLWLALQLAKEGYPVWCDLTKLLGGEDFWADIEDALRSRTIKFLYVLTRTSNRKSGPLKELYVAEAVQRSNKLQDFIIPLVFDDLPYADFNIQVARLNAIPFAAGWANGLERLMQKLVTDGVAKSSNFTPQSVNSWWRGQFDSSNSVIASPEEYLSNRFPICRSPGEVHFYRVHASGFDKVQIPAEFPYPALVHADHLVSFARLDDIEEHLEDHLVLSDQAFSVSDLMEAKAVDAPVDERQARDILFRLLRTAWEQMVAGRGLLRHELANEVCCFFFKKGLVEGDELAFTGIDGKPSHRAVVGYRTVKRGNGATAPIKRIWHFGVQGRPILYPVLGYVIKPHVVFSDDGTNIWPSKARLQSARRSQCKNWWNADWRDRILAVMNWLADETGLIDVVLGKNVRLDVCRLPLTFTSPVSYSDPKDWQALREAAGDREDQTEEEEVDETDEHAD